MLKTGDLVTIIVKYYKKELHIAGDYSGIVCKILVNSRRSKFGKPTK